MEETNSSQTTEILAQFSSANPDELRCAAFDAGAMRVVEAVPLLVKLIESSNLGVQEAAEDALRAIRGSAAVRGVAPLLRSDNASIRNSAMDILREIGEDDIKVLAGLLSDEDPDIRIFSADILGTCNAPSAMTLLADALLHDVEVNVRYQAAISMGALGSPGAADTLRKAMGDEEWVQFAVVEALAKIRAESCVDILIHALSQCSELVASTIIDALGEMNNFKAVPLLLQQLDTASGPLRNKAVKAIVQILGARSLNLLSPKDKEKFQSYLLSALEDEDEDILSAALTGLSGLGSTLTTRAVLKLGARLDPAQEHDKVVAVVRCLVGMGFNEALAAALQDPDELCRNLAVEACCHLPNCAAVPALTDAFWSFARDTQRVAMDYLSKQADKPQIPFFEEVLERHTDAHVIKGALMFLGETVHHTNSAPCLFNFLRHPYDDVKEVALDACIALNDPEVNSALAAMYSEHDPLLRTMAVYAMGQIGCDGYFEQLAEALGDELPDIRKIALEALAADPEQLEARLPLLIDRLNDENREVRLALIDVLGASGLESTSSLLLRALEDQDDWVRIRAVEALARRRVSEAVPHMVRLLELNNLMVMLKVIEALGAIGDNVAFRTLLGVMGHEDPEVQQAAAEAIARIREEQGGDF